jgi:hypothetical protein
MEGKEGIRERRRGRWLPGGLGGKRRALKGAGRGMANVTAANARRHWEDSEEKMPGRR